MLWDTSLSHHGWQSKNGWVLGTNGFVLGANELVFDVNVGLQFYGSRGVSMIHNKDIQIPLILKASKIYLTSCTFQNPNA